MSHVHSPGYQGTELLRAASAAAERAPQLAQEIRAHARTFAARVSSGARVGVDDIDARTLAALIGQTGVQVPMATARTA